MAMSTKTIDWRLKRLAALVDAEGGKAPLGRKLGYKDGAFVGQMLRGERPISEKTVDAVHDMLGYSGWFDRDTASSPPTVDSVIFHQLDIAAACGDGYQNVDYPELVRSIILTRAEAREALGSYNLSDSIQIIAATGESMAPTIKPRDLLFVNTSVKEYRGEGIYLLTRRYEGLICKRLSMAGRTLMVSSENQTIPSWKWKDREDTDAIVGRVLVALPMDFKRF
jgi:hypothetical protein